jgi:hypothetical protein
MKEKYLYNFRFDLYISQFEKRATCGSVGFG